MTTPTKQAEYGNNGIILVWVVVERVPAGECKCVEVDREAHLTGMDAYNRAIECGPRFFHDPRAFNVEFCEREARA